MTNTTRWSALLGAALMGCLTMGAQEESSRGLCVPVLQAGPVIGRVGDALGEEFLIEINPTRRIAIDAFLGHSGVNGYNAGQGIIANYSNVTPGLGGKGRILWFGRGHVILSAYGTAAYSGSQVRAKVPDGFGGMVVYTSNSREPLVAIGSELAFVFSHGAATMIFRIGRNFCDDFALKADGLSLETGLLIDVKKTGQIGIEGIGAGLRKVFRVPPPLP